MLFNHFMNDLERRESFMKDLKRGESIPEET